MNLDRVSHRITSLKAEGNNFIGKAQILATPMGNIAKNLLEEGVKLGVSSRGMGSIDRQENANYVMDDFMLATAADIVADPSAPDAFVNGIMEGKEWVWDNGILQEKTVSKYQRHINESSRRDWKQEHYRCLSTSSQTSNLINKHRIIIRNLRGNSNVRYVKGKI